MRILSSFFICLLILFTACQKAPNPNTQPIEPNQGLDSAFLLKSISLSGQNSNEVSVESYDYDTVKRVITQIYGYDDGSQALEFPRKLFYNEDSLIERIQNPDINPYNYDDEEKQLVFTYDSKKRLSSVKLTQYNGEVHLIPFIWEDTQDGYKISWMEPAGFNYATRWTDTSYVTAYFNAADQLLLRESQKSDFNGVEFVTNRYGNALYYDADGSFTRYTTFRIDNDGNRVDEKLQVEITGRLDNGTQLRDQRELLMHGVANLPCDLFTNEFGVLSSFNFGPEHFQYTNTPFQVYKGILNGGTGNNYDSYTGASQVDAEGRLRVFTGVFHDISLQPLRYELNYYKD